MNRILVFGALVTAISVWSTANAQIYSKTETVEYHDDETLWVLGQVKRTTTNGIETSRTEYGWKANPIRTFKFGKLQQTLGYYTSNGTVSLVLDGNNNRTIFRAWMRGIPQQIEYADGNSIRAYVNDAGLIETITDENGNKTCYRYDSMGRIDLITYPSETQAGVCDTSTWNAVTMAFQQINADEHGLPAGHWRQSRYQGNKHVNTYYDAMWRPILEEQLDYANIAGTLSQTVKRYDASGRLAFQSYPTTNVGDFNSITQGVRTTYDALDRATRVEQDSELGVLASTTEYLTGFQTRDTNPRGLQVTTEYQAYDQPTTDFPAGITTSADTATEIHRDVFGKTTLLVRRDHANTQRVERRYVYDGYQQLCKAIEPETGATVMDYDGAGNLVWSARGLAGSNYADPTLCSRNEGATSGRAAVWQYDSRNRPAYLFFPDHRGDQSWTYTPDGLVATAATDNEGSAIGRVNNAYTYNKRRMLTGESVSQPGWYGWGIGYGYDANGGLSTQTYPTGLVVNYAPNALGQATQVGSYAIGVQYYPNGGIKQFTYGNGLVHTMTQNARQLPWRVTDSGNAMDFEYSYDKNANVSQINDYVLGTPTPQNRGMGYDGLDRLLWTSSQMYGVGQVFQYKYDALDNLKSAKLDTVKDYAYYIYDPTSNLLTSIKDSNGATIVGLGYDDGQGNITNKNGRLYDFDYGNRLRSTAEEWYRYDSYGRRVLNWRATEAGVLSQYSRSGQLMYDENYRASARKSSTYIYLAGSLVATNEWNFDIGTGATKYQHTDALGSPVAVTDAAGAVIERTNYEPYGAAFNKPAYDGIGYTGHVMDSATGLTYMQQRYYDPQVGRFLSVDPVAANPGTGANFNRYWYANDNPYKFTDPDGRAVWPTPSNFNVDMSQRVPNEVSNAWQQAEQVNVPKTVYASGTLGDAAGGGLVGGKAQGGSLTAAASLKEGGTVNATGPQALLTTPAGAVRLEATRNGVEATQLKAQVVGAHAGSYGWEAGISALSTANKIDNMDTKTTITFPYGSISWGSNRNGNGWSIGISVSKLTPALSYVRTEEKKKVP